MNEPLAFEVQKDNIIPKPPFWGTRCIEKIPVQSILPYVNRTALYKVQWGFKTGNRSIEAYREFVRTTVDPIVTRLIQADKQQNILQPKAIYGYFPAQAHHETLIVYQDPDSQKEIARFDFPRQKGKRGLCISDFFYSVDSGKMDVVAFQIVTVGQHAADFARDLFHQNQYQDYLYWHGLNVEVTEGLAEYIHKRIRVEWGFAAEDARDIKQLFKQDYRGSRYSFGYPACPRLEDQVALLAILQADRIGITISEEFQLHPEESTSALVVHHPQAKYFVI